MLQSSGKIDTQIKTDRANLRKLGYIQELDRSIGIFSNFALSFSVISILTGLITLYGFGQEGSGAYLFWSWPIVGIFQLFMSLCLGEIASCYPVTGGVYKWTDILSNSHIGWFNGWFSVIGWLACTLGINYGLAEFILMFLGYENYGLFATLGTLIIVIVIQTMIGMFGIKLVTKINNVSVGIHIFGVIAISSLVIVFSGHGINWDVLSIKIFISESHASNYIPALLMSAWTLTAFDASANISEETIDPSRTVPYGMILSVLVSAVFGSILLFGLKHAAMAVPDLSSVNSSVVLYLFRELLGSTLSKFITLLLIVAMFTCGLASQTVTIRIIFAFSRDNGLPFSGIWKTVPQGYNIPVYSALLCGVLEVLLVIILRVFSVLTNTEQMSLTPGPLRSLPTITSISTVGIYLSYFIVSAAALSKRKKISQDHGTFRNGKAGLAINIIALLWSLTVSIVALFYLNMTTTVFFLLYFAGITIYYFASMRKVLKYKYRALSEDELIQIETMRGL